MNKIQIFNNPDLGNVRTLLIDGVPYLAAIDVAKSLGYKKPRNAIAQHVDSEDALKQGALTKGGSQQLTFINESGMYALIFGSKLETAKKFKRWVTSEVLPSLRKNGEYSMNPPQQSRQIASRRTYTVTEIAAEIGITACDLNCELKEEGIQIRNGRSWVLIRCLRDKGYTVNRYFRKGTDSDGNPIYVPYMVWTEKGREFILETYNLEELI